MSSTQRLRLVFAALMSLWMSLLMTAFVVWLNLGLDAAYLGHWGHAFAAAWAAGCAAPPEARSLLPAMAITIWSAR